MTMACPYGGKHVLEEDDHHGSATMLCCINCGDILKQSDFTNKNSDSDLGNSFAPAAYSKMAEWGRQLKCNVSSGDYKRPPKGFTHGTSVINDVGNFLKLNSAIVDDALNLYIKAYGKENILKISLNRKRIIATACVLVVCRQNSVPVTFKELCQLIQVPMNKLSKEFKLLLKVLKITVPCFSFENFVTTFCTNISLSEGIIERVKNMIPLVSKTGNLSGFSYERVVVAMSYLAWQAADVQNRFKVSLKKFMVIHKLPGYSSLQFRYVTELRENIEKLATQIPWLTSSKVDKKKALYYLDDVIKYKQTLYMKYMEKCREMYNETDESDEESNDSVSGGNDSPISWQDAAVPDEDNANPVKIENPSLSNLPFSDYSYLLPLPEKNAPVGSPHPCLDQGSKREEVTISMATYEKPFKCETLSEYIKNSAVSSMSAGSSDKSYAVGYDDKVAIIPCSEDLITQPRDPSSGFVNASCFSPLDGDTGINGVCSNILESSGKTGCLESQDKTGIILKGEDSKNIMLPHNFKGYTVSLSELDRTKDGEYYILQEIPGFHLSKASYATHKSNSPVPSENCSQLSNDDVSFNLDSFDPSLISYVCSTGDGAAQISGLSNSTDCGVKSECVTVKSDEVFGSESKNEELKSPELKENRRIEKLKRKYMNSMSGRAFKRGRILEIEQGLVGQEQCDPLPDYVVDCSSDVDEKDMPDEEVEEYLRTPQEVKWIEGVYKSTKLHEMPTKRKSHD